MNGANKVNFFLKIISAAVCLEKKFFFIFFSMWIEKPRIIKC